ncbi:MAG: hypothetical protein WA728_33280, partial [Xanthobacteraceae bacterium]
MINPISGQLLDIEEGHCIDYGIGVAAGGGEETVDMAPAAVGLDPDASMLAPGSGPGAGASPGNRSRGIRPEPVSTALSTAPALPRS